MPQIRFFEDAKRRSRRLRNAEAKPAEPAPEPAEPAIPAEPAMPARHGLHYTDVVIGIRNAFRLTNSNTQSPKHLRTLQNFINAIN